MLNAVLQQIGQSNPQLLNLISQNQEAFIRMVNEPESGSGGESGGSSGGTPRGAGGLLGDSAMIQVSPQDKEAIERVGFPLLFQVILYLSSLFSSRPLDFQSTLWFRLTLLVTRTKIWRRISFCLRALTTKGEADRQCSVRVKQQLLCNPFPPSLSLN